MTTAVINQIVQIAKELVAGTAPATDYYQLVASKLENQSDPKFDTFKGAGSRHLGVSNLTSEETKLTLSGRADYNDIYIWLAGALCEPVTTQLIPTTGLAYEHIFEPDSDGPNARFTYTAKLGDSSYAEQVSYLTMQSLGLKLPRTGSQEIAGSAIGKALLSSISDGIAMNGSATKLAKAPMPAPHFAMFLADTAAGLAAAPQLTSPFLSEWMLDAIAAAVYGYNRTTTFNETIETDPKGTAKLKLPVNATSVGMRTTMKEGDMKFLRIQALGRVIEGVTREELTVDTALFITSAPSKGADQGALALEYGYEWADDEVSGLGTTVTLVNTFEGM